MAIFAPVASEASGAYVVASSSIALYSNLADESDNKFVDAAIAAAAIIVTYNLRHFRAGDLLRHGWTVMTPAEFVTRYLGEEE